MKICRDCKNQLKPAGGYENSPESLCKAYEVQNHVTGEMYFIKCKKINTLGICIMWSEKAK